MTHVQLLKCSLYRNPDSVNSTTTAAGVRDQLGYKLRGFTHGYVYLTNGIVDAIQD